MPLLLLLLWLLLLLVLLPAVLEPTCAMIEIALLAAFLNRFTKGFLLLIFSVFVVLLLLLLLILLLALKLEPDA
jgi:hypothetical protein